MNARSSIAAVGAAAALVAPAAAAPVKWLPVKLGTHRFGELTAPDAIAAHASAREVGFSRPGNGKCGCGDGPRRPMVFHMAPDRAIWLLDDLRHRLLVWRPGRPAHPGRRVAIPRDLNVRDFAVGLGGTVYLTTGGDAGRPNLFALDRSGKLRWTARTTIGVGNARLQLGPDGALYTPSAGGGPMHWARLTTRDGRPLSLAEQRKSADRAQPMPGGLRLLETQLSAHEVHVALVGEGGRIVRAWRITSRTVLGLPRARPALVGGDLVVPLDMTRQVRPDRVLWENVVVRLGRAGGTTRRISLDARAVLGDPSGAVPLEIGPDGRLYQLRRNPKTGVRVARFPLG